jgi:hypothetical protein
MSLIIYPIRLKNSIINKTINLQKEPKQPKVLCTLYCDASKYGVVDFPQYASASARDSYLELYFPHSSPVGYGVQVPLVAPFAHQHTCIHDENDVGVMIEKT